MTQDKIYKRLKATYIRELNENAISFELEEEEVTTSQINEEYEKAISDLVDEGVLKLDKKFKLWDQTEKL